MQKLSIITINYNNKLGLSKTINSIITQSATQFEYIIIDGGSTDGSKELIVENEKDIDKWVYETDKGIYNAMNKGVKMATSEFVLFINSGDVLFDNDVILKTLHLLDSNFSFIYGNLFYNENGKNVLFGTHPDKLSFTYFIQNSLPHPACFMKRELFDKHFYYNENLKIVADWEFFIYCICKENEPYKHINTTISNFDVSGVSSNPNNKLVMDQEHQYVFEKHFPLFIDEIKIINEHQGTVNFMFEKIKTQKFRWSILKRFIKLLSINNPKKPSPYENIYNKID